MKSTSLEPQVPKWEARNGADAGETANHVQSTLNFPTVNERRKIKQNMLLKPGILTHV